MSGPSQAARGRTQAERAVDELVDVAGRATIGAILTLLAHEVAEGRASSAPGLG